MIPASQDAPPLILGRYRVVQQLARGGMGVVYLGRVEGTAGFAKPVVIKRMLVSFDDSQTEMAARFVREAKILSNLAHPGIVGVVDFGQDEGGYAMVLDYVNGFDLGRWLNYSKKLKRKIDWEQAAMIVASVLDALHYAHTLTRSDGGAAQVVHRDISPGNILIDSSGAVRLADFGVARMAGYADDHHTRAGVVPGKLSYMAPELLEGVGASPASDVYATGLVLYQLLTGKNPFRGEGQVRTLALVALGAAPPVLDARPDVPPALSSLLTRALSRSPPERPESAGSFARELRALLRSDETAIQAKLREQVQVDYEKLPGALGLVSLGERERAWRSPSSPSQAESRPRPRSAGESGGRASARVDGGASSATVPQRGRKLPPPAPSRPLDPPSPWARAPARRASDAPAESRAALPAEELASAVDGPQEGPTLASIPVVPLDPLAASGGRAGRFRLRWIAAAGGSLLLALAFLASGALSLGPTSPAFVVLERAPSPSSAALSQEAAPQSPAAGAHAERAGLTPLPPPETSPPSQPPPTKPAPKRKKARPRKKPSLSQRLSRGFARRQTDLTRCFEKNPSKTKDISVKFTVDAEGKVTAARLQPSSVESKPLGRCVLGVARSTQFERPGRDLQFTIPLVLTGATRP